MATGLVAYALQPPAQVPDYAVAAGGPVPQIKPTDPPPNMVRPSDDLAGEIARAVNASRWPTLSPPIGELGTQAAQASWAGCRGGTEATCTFGLQGSAKRVVVMGDSIAMAWLPAITAALGDNWTIHGLTKEQCPAADVPVVDGQTPPVPLTACDDRHAWVLQQVQRLDPQAVILASESATMKRVDGGVSAYQAALERTITMLRSAAPSLHVVTLTAPPDGPSLTTCATPSSAPSACITRPSTTWDDAEQAERAAASATGTAQLDPRLLFCTAQDVCPAFVGTTPVRFDGAPVRFDGAHLTPQYSAMLGPDLASGLASVGVR